MCHTQPPRGKRVWEAPPGMPYPVAAGKSGYGSQVCVSHTQSLLGKRVWEAPPGVPYPVTTRKEGIGGAPVCAIPGRRRERGYRRRPCMCHTRSPPGKWVWEAGMSVPYPVAAGKAGMGGTSACTIPSRRRERGYGRHLRMHHTRSPPGKADILDNKDNIFCSDHCRNMPYRRG